MSTLSMKDYIIKNHELDKFKLLYLENAPRLIFYASKYVDNPLAELNWKYYVPKSCTYRRILVT